MSTSGRVRMDGLHYHGAMHAAIPATDSLVTPLAWGGRDGVIEGCNAAFSRWLGVSARRLLGWPVAALDAGDGRLADAVTRTGASAAPLRMRRMRLSLADGEERFADLWLHWHREDAWLLEAHPVDEFPGDDPAVLLPSALSAALKGLAHELRNPLAGVKGAAQLLARRYRQDAESVELTALIEAEVERLTQLLDQLLSPRPVRPHEALNCHAVLERVLRLAESEAGWAVKLTRDYDPSVPDLVGDSDRLTQAVWNLVRNAIQAGASQVILRTRVERGVRIGDHLHPMMVRLDIIDDGRGVPEALSEQLFLPLVSGRADGTGLGLALAQQVAREHKGSLAYRSRPGHTVFVLLLPVVAGSEGEHAG